MLTNTAFQDFLENLYEELKSCTEGNVADYIPQLAKVNADDFGIAIATVDGHVYQVGDSQTRYSIQSISKAFTYGIALQDQGIEAVFRRVDVEPSGEAFNSISLEPDTGRPRNPMINAGAIAITGLVDGETKDDKIQRILDVFALYTGHELEIDDSIYLSEKETGHRNRAISHLLKNYEVLDGEPEETLDAYFQQCSILVNARDLALMGSCLANNGVNPVSGIRTLPEKYVPSVLSVMASCGMYDYSGNWIYNVGMPAKSGVGGDVVAVLPGQFGLSVYSPRLDIKGNSVRGIKVCEKFSSQFGLHMLHTAKVTSSTVIRANYDGTQVRSKRERHPDEAKWLDENGKKIVVFELMGELTFVSTELVLRETAARVEHCEYFIIDFSRVTSIDESASHLLVDLILRYKTDNRTILFVGMDRKYSFSKYIRKQLLSLEQEPILRMSSYDQALEWCEDSLLEAANADSLIGIFIDLEDQPICEGMSAEEIAYLRAITTEENYQTGMTICHEGDSAEYVYIPLIGKVSAWINVDHKRKTRLGGSAAGWVFGESALLGNQIRSADIIADSNVIVRVLKAKDLIESDHQLSQAVLSRMFMNLSRLYDQRLRRANAQIRSLSL